MKKFKTWVADSDKLKKMPKVSGTIPDLPELPDVPSVPDVSLPDIPLPNLPDLHLVPLKKAVDDAQRVVNSLLKLLSINPKILTDSLVSTKGILGMWLIYVLVIWTIEVYMLPLAFCLILMKNFILVKCRNMSWFTKKFGNILEFAMNADDENQTQDEDIDESKGQTLKSILTPLLALQGAIPKVQQQLKSVVKTGDGFVKLMTWEDPSLTRKVTGVLVIFTVFVAVFSIRLILLLSGSLGFLKLLRYRRLSGETQIGSVTESYKDSENSNVDIGTTETLKNKTE